MVAAGAESPRTAAASFEGDSHSKTTPRVAALPAELPSFSSSPPSTPTPKLVEELACTLVRHRVHIVLKRGAWRLLASARARGTNGTDTLRPACFRHCWLALSG